MRVETDYGIGRNVKGVVCVIDAPQYPRLKQLEFFLDEIQAVVSNIDDLFKQNSLRSVEGFFKFEMEFDDKSRMGEMSFWEGVVEAKVFDEKIIKYIQTITAVGVKHQDPGLWWDEEYQPGAFAINALIRRDLRPYKKHLRLYADYIASNAMWDEVHQEAMIKYILKNSGLTPDALYLIATRLTRARGNWGIELLTSHGSMLNYSLELTGSEKMFLQMVCDFELPKESPPPGERLEFVSYILFDVATVVYGHDLLLRDSWLETLKGSLKTRNVDLVLHSYPYPGFKNEKLVESIVQNRAAMQTYRERKS